MKYLLVAMLLLLSGCGTTVRSVFDPIMSDISDIKQEIRETIPPAVEDVNDRLSYFD